MIIANMFSNKELNAIVTELFTKDKKLNIPFFLLHNFILL